MSVLDAPLVVVLGHDSCGAIAAARAAADGGRVPGGFVRDAVERVTPNVSAVRAAGRDQAEETLAEHIEHTVELLLERSRALAERVAAPRLADQHDVPRPKEQRRDAYCRSRHDGNPHDSGTRSPPTAARPARSGDIAEGDTALPLSPAPHHAPAPVRDREKAKAAGSKER